MKKNKQRAIVLHYANKLNFDVDLNISLHVKLSNLL